MIAENFLPLRVAARWLPACAGGRIEFAGSMPVSGILHRRLVSLAFDSVQMQDARPAHPLDLVQHFHELGHIVAVEWPEVSYVEALEYILLPGNKGFEGIPEA